MAIDEAKAQEILQGGNNDSASGESGKTTGDAGNQKVYEVNGKQYTPDKFDDAMKDYQNHLEMTKRQGEELGELRKKVETQPDTTQQTQSDELTPEQDEYNKKMLFDKYGVMTKEDFNKAQYDRDKTQAAKQVAERLGVKADDIINEVDELNSQTKGQVAVDKIEKVWAVNHPDEYLAFKSKLKEQDRVDTHYTERTTREGIELPQPDVPKFGASVEKQALELIGQKGVE